MLFRSLEATGRTEIAKLADAVRADLQADPEVLLAPEHYYDRVIEIDLSRVEPHINGPFTPDLATPISEFAKKVKENGYPQKLEVGLIGSCTNSSYEDITRAASVIKQALAHNISIGSELLINPGSEKIRATIARDGLLDVFDGVGATVMANACGPCIGQWKRHSDDPNRKIGRASCRERV